MWLLAQNCVLGEKPQPLPVRLSLSRAYFTVHLRGSLQNPWV